MYFYTRVWKRIKEKLVHLFLLFLYEAINDTDRHLNSYSSKQYLMHCARFTKWLMFLYFFPMIFRPGIRITGQSVLEHSPRIFLLNIFFYQALILVKTDIINQLKKFGSNIFLRIIMMYQQKQ